jgi:arylsulfatase A-like enzyme
VNAVVLPWLQKHAAQSFFLMLSYNDLRRATDPLTVEEQAHRSHLAAYGDPAWPDELTFSRHVDLHAAFSLRAQGMMDLAAAWKLVHDYNARIRAVDDAVAEVLALLDTLNIARDTAVAVVSDHGVLLGECGCYGGVIGTQYHAARVPLILRAPGMMAGTRLAHPCYTLDLAPTICALFGFAAPAGWQGINLLDQAAATPPARPHVVCSHGQYTAQRSLIAGSWKMNRTWHNGFWDFPDTELFNLAADPLETDNRAPHEPQRMVEMLRAWRQWHEQCQPGNADPLARIACDEPPGFVLHGQELRARVRAGGLTAPAAYRGRWA